eukprot:GEMP01082573.1.p1 GENE.GEMP01082573.1~~GEMP01082573.1.p1  ORF type:complete len:200 (+),score=38.96 GEMP01082573.1:78-677(+)
MVIDIMVHDDHAIYTDTQHVNDDAGTFHMWAAPRHNHGLGHDAAHTSFAALEVAKSMAAKYKTGLNSVLAMLPPPTRLAVDSYIKASGLTDPEEVAGMLYSKSTGKKMPKLDDLANLQKTAKDEVVKKAANAFPNPLEVVKNYEKELSMRSSTDTTVDVARQKLFRAIMPETQPTPPPNVFWERPDSELPYDGIFTRSF